MVQWLILLLFTAMQLFTGLGIVRLFRIWTKPGMLIPLWLLMGMAVFSVVPFLLQLFYIPLTASNIFIALGITCVLLNVRYRKSISELAQAFRESRFRIRLYEIPFFLVIAFLVLISVWRCFYLPPTPRDLTSGPEVIAEYAVKEKTMINSVFTVNLESTNNPFKPPFIASLQIIYKYAGFYFGQIWLSAVFICFLVFLYHAIGHTMHALLKGLLLVAFLAIPEMYAYTFMALFDYSNAVYFFLACYFLFEYFNHGQKSYLPLAGTLMGIATYIRSETLVLTCFVSTILLWKHIRKWKGWRNFLFSFGWFVLPAAVFYGLSISLYIHHYLPVSYAVGDLVNSDLLNLASLWNRFASVNSSLISGSLGIVHYSYFFYLFLFILLCDLIWYGRLSLTTRNWLFAVMVIYFGLPLLGHLLPLMDIANSTKRGMFKIFPLMLLYMGNSPWLLWISGKLKDWEAKGKNSISAGR